MAILQMERIHLVAMKRDRKRILEMLQRRGIVEVKNAEGEDEIFQKTDTSNSCAVFQKSADTAHQAVEILDAQVELKKPFLAFLEGPKAVSVDECESFYGQHDSVLRTAQEIVRYDREIAEANAELLRIDAQIEALGPWITLPMAQSFSGTKNTSVFIGVLPGEQTLALVLQQLAEVAPQLDKIHVELVSTSEHQTCMFAVVPKAEEVQAEEALRAIGFAKPANISRLVPAEQQTQLQEQRKAAEEKIAKAQEAIASKASQRNEIQFFEDHMLQRSEKYQMIDRLMQSKHVFVLDGYVPKKYSGKLQEDLTSKFECSVEIEGVTEDEDVPILLQNNSFVQPVEGVLEGYALPTRQDIDPSNIMTFFYFVLFGLMFSDAAYGLLMMAVCGGLLVTVKNIAPNWQKNLKLFFWCGVSTFIWGLLFGSFFGDVVTVISETFFGQTVNFPMLWFDPLADPMQLLLFSLGLGILHLTVGFILKGATCAKNKQYIDIVWDAVLPLTLFYPLLIMLMGSEMFEGIAGTMLMLPSWGQNACLAVAGISAVGLVLFGDRSSKGIVKRLLKGAFALYNTLTGWLSDIFSYARLLALGLATSVIGSVFNTLGSLFGTGIAGVIGFIALFLVGHALNFGINVLGAYVHSNRLEYVEFFGKFYEGGGRKFEPFGIHTKNYKIEEETQNV